MALDPRLRLRETIITIDLCMPCQAFWFDTHESLKLSPASTLKLIQIIGSQSPSERPKLRNDLDCPRCAGALKLTHDMQRSTRFSYWMCEPHGRFVLFFDFLREKNFIRPLTAAEIDEMRQNIQTVNCSNCGAAIDLAGGTLCTHCGSPITILDMKQPREMLAQLRQAAAAPKPDLNAPSSAATPGDTLKPWWFDDHADDFLRDASSSGLVMAGLRAMSRWLDKSGVS